jgi:hypothetical protein
MTLQAFEKWAIDFVGPINPPGKRIGARYIITMTEYLTRWAEARAVKVFSATTTAHFIFDDIITSVKIRSCSWVHKKGERKREEERGSIGHEHKSEL